MSGTLLIYCELEYFLTPVLLLKRRKLSHHALRKLDFCPSHVDCGSPLCSICIDPFLDGGGAAWTFILPTGKCHESQISRHIKIGIVFSLSTGQYSINSGENDIRSIKCMDLTYPKK